MAVDVTDVAQAIVDALSDPGNAAEFAEEFNVVRVYTLGKSLIEYASEQPQVFVIPRSEVNETHDRVDDRFDLGIGIAIIRPVENTDIDTIDPLLALPRSIRDFLKEPGRDMAGCENETCTIEVLFGHDELYEDSCLVTTIGLNYEILQ